MARPAPRLPRPRPVTVGIRGEGEQVAVAVHNRGAVIPPERLDGIFNPIKARQAPRKAPGAGPTGSLGLGLYIAERIVSAHGGRVEAASSEPAGTTFTSTCRKRDADGSLTAA
jgi:signal transduction histidine kinase